ncbi:LLM class flavin-dependent oxidoreductase [Streptomyces sp. NPDC056534]|uniref:LLM class flavin-dependent oxidoreductase n=1 Tax=Streptomyces sp. NPDC056534 TaxID=3345857 RepID=UPI0036BB7F4E
MKTSVLLPFVPKRPEEVLPFGGLVSWSSASRLWQGHSTLADSHHTFSYLAGAGFRPPIGFGISLMALRNPFDAAVQARSVALMTGQPVVAGFGPGALDFQRGMMGQEYRSQIGACREYLTVVRGLLDGGEVDHAGDYFEVHAQLPPCPAPRVEVGLGVIRRRAAALAGEIADVAITWLTPARYIAETIAPAIAEGAERAGRQAPRVVAIVPVALEKDNRDPAVIALASNGPHLSTPHYQSMLRSGGVPLTGDLQKDAALLVENGAFLYGDEEQLVKQLMVYQAAGVDEVVLNTTGVSTLYGRQAAVRECAQILGCIEKASGS